MSDATGIDLNDPIQRALAYPYDVASASFLFDRGTVRPLPVDYPRTGTPVLGIGSNRAPSQLRHKYRHTLADTVIACEHARLVDHDIVYLAAFTRYGALPAALVPMPGVTVEVHLLWLDDRALARMHETEGPHNYGFTERADLTLTMVDEGPVPTVPLGLYQSKPRLFEIAGAPVPLAALAAIGRQTPALDQRAVLEAAHRRLAPSLAFDDFLDRAIADDDQRSAWTAALQAAA